MSIKFPKQVIYTYLKDYITDNIEDKYDPWLNINSVFTSDNKHKLGFNPQENRVFDFKLGQGWTIPEFMMEYDPDIKSEATAQAILLKIFMKYKKSGQKLEFSSDRPKIIKPVELQEIKNIPNMKNLTDKNVFNSKIGKRAIKFIQSKNLTFEHAKKFKLKYVDDWNCWNCDGEGEINGQPCPVCDKSSGRNPYYGFLIIPTYENDNLVYFQARNTNVESSFRYRNPPLSRIQVVYFYDQLKENDRIFITEGPMDAMTLKDYSATCIMGNRLSDPQILKIFKKNPTEIIFVPDYDPDENVRNNIFRTLKKNIDKVKFHRDNKKIKIGVYEWYKKHLIDGKKDINDINHNKIEDELIKYEL